MPGWHRKTKNLVSQGKLKVAGIVQEQHPDRAALYMQWQQMDWPLLADPFNELGISAVPITLLIDEHGVIRFKNPRGNDLKKFLESDYSPKGKAQKIQSGKLDITSLEKVVKDSPKNARAHFRLGVAYRMRYDSEKGEPEDFSKAVGSWAEALRLNPNQYIWRRRIQQYGPRLDKPYSFYDWVTKAREEITKRGETPHPLTCEPTGSEFAFPEKRKGGKGDVLAKHPDPEGKITRDVEKVTCETVVVSSTKKSSPAVRVHLSFQVAGSSTWTNDAGELSFHLEESDEVSVHDLKISDLPKEVSSNEDRQVEFELRPKKGKTLPKEISGAAFYYICTSDDGVCEYLRQDVKITLP